jgi:polyisoprenoid-binding protein YceI
MAWQIDPAHSEVLFSVKHMMISTVRGKFTRFSGTVEADEQNPTGAQIAVQIEAASLDTGNEQRDGHLRSPDFFDVERFPTITFKSTRVEQRGDSDFALHGDLTIRDVTKPVVLDVEYAGQAKSPWGVTSAGFSAQTKINRKEWGLNWNVALETGGWLVSDEIRISIEVELMHQAEQAGVEAEAEAESLHKN